MDDAQLQPPPAPLSINDVLPDTLPQAWNIGKTIALAIYEALVQTTGKPLPWQTVQDAIEGVFRARRFELAANSQNWPCNFASTSSVRFQIPRPTPAAVEAISASDPIASAQKFSEYSNSIIQEKAKTNRLVATAELQTHELQDLSDKIADIKSVAAGIDLKLTVQIELGGESRPSDEAITQINLLLQEISENLKLQ